MPKPKIYHKRLVVLIKEDLWRDLKMISKEEKKTISKVSRELLKSEIKKRNNKELKSFRDTSCYKNNA